MKTENDWLLLLIRKYRNESNPNKCHLHKVRVKQYQANA